MVNTVIIVRINERNETAYVYANNDCVGVTPCRSYTISSELNAMHRRSVDTRDEWGHCTGSFLADRIYVAHSQEEQHHMAAEIFANGEITDRFAVEVI